MTNKNVTEHFTYPELACNCCNRIMIIPLFYEHMELLEKMRQKLGFGIMVNSGYRCPNHNKAVNGSKNSWHMKFATDVRPAWDAAVDDNEFLKRLGYMREEAYILDFGGIGTYDTFLHLDLRPNKTRWNGK